MSNTIINIEIAKFKDLYLATPLCNDNTSNNSGYSKDKNTTDAKKDNNRANACENAPKKNNRKDKLAAALRANLLRRKTKN